MKFKSEVQLEALNNATVDTDKFLVSDSTTVKYRTGAQVLSDLGVSGVYVPYTGATGNVDLGTHTLLAKDLIINHSSGSGVAASITKNGSGEALTVIKGSGSGNAMSVTGGLTSLVDLSLSTVANATGDFLTHSGSTINKRTPAQVLSDIGGQAALTNPITGTGTTNYVSKFTGSTSLGDSQIFDNGTNVGIGTTSPSNKLDVSGTARATSTMTATKLIPTGNVTTGNGMYLPTTNTVAFSTNGGERLRITAGGNVGIGTTSPSQKLDVSGSIAISQNAEYIYGKTSSGVNVRLLGINAGNVAYVGAIDSGPTSTIFNASSTSLSSAFYTAGTERMRIDGNVGIGNTVPNSKLHVSNVDSTNTDYNSLSSIKIHNNYAGAFGRGSSLLFSNASENANNEGVTAAIKSSYRGFNATNKIGGDLTFYTKDAATENLPTEKVRIDGVGNVGIGTTTPTYKLDVDGTGRFNDTVTALDFIQDGDIAKTTISTAVTITDEQDLFYKVKTGRLIVTSFFEALTTASSQVIATLPIGARPETARNFVVLNNNNSFGGVGTIQTNGNIIMSLTNGEVYILDFELTLDF